MSCLSINFNIFKFGHNYLIMLVQKLSTVQDCVLRGEAKIFCALASIFAVSLIT